MRPRFVNAAADLGQVGSIGAPFDRFQEVAKGARPAGERVKCFGYALRSWGKAFAERRYEAKVKQIVGGGPVLDKEPDRGTSGSGVLTPLAARSW